MQLLAQRRAILRSKEKGEVEFSSVEIEKPTYGNTVTMHPVERGQDVSDHVKPEADEISIQGVIVGVNAADKLSRLLQFRREGLVLDYIGRNGIDRVVIKGLSTEHHVRIHNGYYFTLNLMRVRIASSLMTQIKMPSAKPVTNVGRQQPAGNTEPKETMSYTIVWGDTLTALAKRYDTTIDHLMKLNPQIKDPNKIYAGRQMTVPRK